MFIFGTKTNYFFNQAHGKSYYNVHYVYYICDNNCPVFLNLTKFVNKKSNEFCVYIYYH